MPSDGRSAGLRAGDMLLVIPSPTAPLADDALSCLCLLLGCLEDIRCFATRELLAEQCGQTGLVLPGEMPAPSDCILWITVHPERLSTVLSVLLQLGFAAPLVEGRLR